MQTCYTDEILLTIYLFVFGVVNSSHLSHADTCTSCALLLLDKLFFTHKVGSLVSSLPTILEFWYLPLMSENSDTSIPILAPLEQKPKVGLLEALKDV